MCIIDCLSTIVFILPLHLDYTKVIILILWWRNFQLEYWRTFQLVSTNHRGIDLKGNNDYVYSIMPGMVVKTGKNKGLGNYVEVRHGDFTSIYGHLYSVLVNAKQAVEAGQPIGISGSTGRSTGEHLHFQMEYKDKTIDPKPILDYINEVIRTVKGQISQQIDNELRRK